MLPARGDELCFLVFRFMLYSEEGCHCIFCFVLMLYRDESCVLVFLWNCCGIRECGEDWVFCVTISLL